MSFVKFFARLGSSIVFYLLFITYLISVLVATKNGGVNSWPETGTPIVITIISLFLIVILDFIRLKYGLSVAMVSNKVRHQNIMFICKVITLSSLMLLIFEYYIAATILFLVSGFGAYIVRIRAWKIYTDIAESDHILFRKRLKISGLIISAFSVLGIFQSTGNFFLVNMFNAALVGYIIASFFIGWTIIGNLYFFAKGVATSAGPTQQQLEDDKMQREYNLAVGSPSPINVGLMSSQQTSDVLVFSVRVIAISVAMLVGLTMIPFYIYVIATKKITILEPTQFRS